MYLFLFAKKNLQIQLKYKYSKLIFYAFFQLERDIMIWNNKRYEKKPLFVKSKEDSQLAKHRRWFSQFYSENSPRLKFQRDTLEWWLTCRLIQSQRKTYTASYPPRKTCTCKSKWHSQTSSDNHRNSTSNNAPCYIFTIIYLLYITLTVIELSFTDVLCYLISMIESFNAYLTAFQILFSKHVENIKHWMWTEQTMTDPVSRCFIIASTDKYNGGIWTKILIHLSSYDEILTVLLSVNTNVHVYTILPFLIWHLDFILYIYLLFCLIIYDIFLRAVEFSIHHYFSSKLVHVRSPLINWIYFCYIILSYNILGHTRCQYIWYNGISFWRKGGRN